MATIQERLSGFLAGLCVSPATGGELSVVSVSHCDEDAYYFLIASVPEVYSDEPDPTLGLWLVQANALTDAFRAVVLEAPSSTISVCASAFKPGDSKAVGTLISTLLPVIQAQMAERLKGPERDGDDTPAGVVH